MRARELRGRNVPMRWAVDLWCLTLVIAIPVAAQRRLSVPTAEAIAAMQGALLDELARVLVQAATPGENVDRLLARAAATEVPSPLRYALAGQAARCALLAGDVPMALRVADSLVEGFAIARADARADALRAFEAEGHVPAQVLAGAWLAEAERLLEGDRAGFAARVSAAERLASADRPRGLAAVVARRVVDLRAMRAAFERCQAAPDDAALRGRYRAFYRGDFAGGLPDLRAPGAGGERVARVAASKRDAHRDGDDPLMLAAVAEQWLSVAADEHEPIAKRNLRRRAFAILGDAYLATCPMMLGNEFEVSEPERARLQRLFDRAGELMAEADDAFVQRFAGPDDLASMEITAGEWRVADGTLIGRSTGEATRATLPWAFARIASVTIRGSIRSAGTLNFRLAVGPCNAILNWELDDVNPIWFGDMEQRVGPRALSAGREHAIHIRQLGEWIGVFVDERLLSLGPGQLAGTVSVYPALGSEIAVRQIEVIGDLDLGRVVRGPSGTAR